MMQTLPELILVMGVAASGKTTIASAVANTLHYHLLDADDFHSKQAISMMAAGTPLNDDIRDAWAERIVQRLKREADAGHNCVLAFSGLRLRHRRILYQAPMQIRAFLLQGAASTLADRIAGRSNHFMPASLLQDQLATLEMPESDEGVELFDIDSPPALIIAGITGIPAPAI